ncbi:PREDICTED: pentatricopeptide repeat-containing protein At5g27460 [Prunus mume]|uniref:Pentatricopeptide repeat-containing protein At5g27460 n=1 Tax=Prunus mume TaxID=102107 RepID=A0ABM0N4D9_PRUMU|nr:PREDICTED: pentatricopeptide repeat-containing protein At5g27460 [Prunus mume]
MATSCGLFTGLRRCAPHFENSVRWRRQLSSLCSSSLPVERRKDDELKSKIFGLKNPGRSATTVIQKWVDRGNKVSVLELRRISIQLLKSKRFDHALQILAWMEAQSDFRLSPGDHATRLESIIKLKGMLKAEEYFENLVATATKKAACLPLLHGYVVEKDTEKAEALMLKLGGLGLIVSPHPYNEMMKLYMGTCQFRKVPLVVVQMKKNKIPLTVLSYNLWMNACAKLSGVASVEMVYKEMVNDVNVQVGWSTLSILANVYMKAGLVDEASLALRRAEEKLSDCNRLGYFFLITQYTSLKMKEDVLRLWEASKAVPGRIPCTNYMHILLCLVKLGDIVEAERIFTEWEFTCFRYDVRISNVLLGAYMRNGMVEKAESLHLHTLQRGGHPNYKTWEILMEGWLKSQNIDKAIEAMKRGFSMLQDCHWRPSDDTIMAFAGYFERHGNIEDANWYVRVIHVLGCASLPLYKSVLRLHLSAQRSASDILKMMEKDMIEMDDETSALVQAFEV